MIIQQHQVHLHLHYKHMELNIVSKVNFRVIQGHTVLKKVSIFETNSKRFLGFVGNL